MNLPISATVDPPSINAQPATPSRLPCLSKTKSWDHQTHGHSQIVGRDALYLNWDMGAGKSKPIVDYVCNELPRLTLIICPKAVMDVWPHQFDVHGWDSGDVRIELLNRGTTVAKASRLRSIASSSFSKGPGHLVRPTVIVTNYDSVWRKDLSNEIMRHQWDLVVLDEAHRIKNSMSKVGRFVARQLSKVAKKRVCLSGTIMPHSPLDAFNQIHFLDPNIFGYSFVQFRARYAILAGPERKFVVGFQRREELHKKIFTITDRIKKEDVLDLPPTSHEFRKVDLTPKVRKAYEELKNKMVTKVDEGVITASNALSMLLRLQQVTSGCVRFEDDEVRRFGEEKQKALADLVSDLPPSDPVVVFCRFRSDLTSVESVAKATGRKHFGLSGSSNTLKAWQGETVDEFEPAGIIGVQIQSGGLGIDLTRARYCAFLSVGWSLGDYQQALARLDRPGQTRKVEYFHIVARDTIDELLYKSLDKKVDVIQSVLEYVRGHGND